MKENSRRAEVEPRLTPEWPKTIIFLQLGARLRSVSPVMKFGAASSQVIIFLVALEIYRPAQLLLLASGASLGLLYLEMGAI